MDKEVSEKGKELIKKLVETKIEISEIIAKCRTEKSE